MVALTAGPSVAKTGDVTMGSLSFFHWLIAIIVVFLLFGSSRIPGMVKGISEGIREFKKGIGNDPHEAKPAPKQADAKVSNEPPSDRKTDE